MISAQICLVNEHLFSLLALDLLSLFQRGLLGPLCASLIMAELELDTQRTLDKF